MAAVCEICGRGVATGNRVSHSNHKTRRRWKVNLHSVRVGERGRRQRLRVCTRCVRSGKVLGLR